MKRRLWAALLDLAVWLTIGADRFYLFVWERYAATGAPYEDLGQ